MQELRSVFVVYCSEKSKHLHNQTSYETREAVVENASPVRKNKIHVVMNQPISYCDDHTKMT